MSSAQADEATDPQSRSEFEDVETTVIQLIRDLRSDNSAVEKLEPEALKRVFDYISQKEASEGAGKFNEHLHEIIGNRLIERKAENAKLPAVEPLSEEDQAFLKHWRRLRTKHGILVDEKDEEGKILHLGDPLQIARLDQSFRFGLIMLIQRHISPAAVNGFRFTEGYFRETTNSRRLEQSGSSNEDPTMAFGDPILLEVVSKFEQCVARMLCSEVKGNLAEVWARVFNECCADVGIHVSVEGQDGA